MERRFLRLKLVFFLGLVRSFALFFLSFGFSGSVVLCFVVESCLVYLAYWLLIIKKKRITSYTQFKS